jgi:hypothetical protein
MENLEMADVVENITEYLYQLMATGDAAKIAVIYNDIFDTNYEYRRDQITGYGDYEYFATKT